MDKKKFKELKKAKSKAIKGGLVLKNDCPFTKDECLLDCEQHKCDK